MNLSGGYDIDTLKIFRLHIFPEFFWLIDWLIDWYKLLTTNNLAIGKMDHHSAEDRHWVSYSSVSAGLCIFSPEHRKDDEGDDEEDEWDDAGDEDDVG